MDSEEKAFAFNRTALYVAILVCAGLALNLGTQALFPEHRTPDSLTYIEPARRLVEGGEFASYARPPGYPIFLSLVFRVADSDLAVVWTQKVLLVFIAVAGYLWFRRAFSHWRAFVGATILLCDVPSLLMANYVLTETLFTAMVFAAFILIYEARRRGGHVWLALGAAIAAAAAAAIRPIAFGLFALYALYLLARRPIRARDVALCAAFALVANVFPILRAVHGKPDSNRQSLREIAGNALLYYQSPAVLSLTTGKSENQAKEELKREEESQVRDRERQLGRGLTSAELGAIRIGLAKRVLLPHPFLALYAGLRGYGKALFGPGYPAYVTSFGPGAARAIHAGQYAVSVLSFLLACIGTVFALRETRQRDFALLAMLTCAALIGPLWGWESYARFRVPIIPYYALFMASGAFGLAGFIRGKRLSAGYASGGESLLARHVWVVFLALYLVVPWIIAKALAGCALLASLGKMRRWSRPSVATALGLFFGLAYIVSPYWALPRYYVNHPLAVAMGPDRFAAVLAFGLLIVGAAWALCSSGPIQWANGSLGPFLTPRRIAPAILAAVIITLSYAPMCGALALDGDESFHIVRTRILGRTLIQLAGKSLPSLGLSLLAAAAFLMWPGRPSRRLRLLVLGAATLTVCLVFGFPAVTLADVPRLTVRYPLASVWFHLMGPVWPSTWYNEAFYRLVSLLSVVCLGWFLLSLLARENVGPVAALLAAVSLVLTPSVFYATSVLYLETPLIVLTALALRDVEPILKSEFEEARQAPGWYALLIAGFLKETMISFIGGVILLRVAARTVILVQERRLSLRKMVEEGLVAFCLLTPVFIYLAFRMSFDYQRPYSPQWGNLFMPSLYAKLAVSQMDQFRVVAVLGALGMILCIARRQGFRVIAIVFISLCGYALYYCDNWPQYFGHWRFNLSLFPMFAIFAVSFLAWLWRKSRIAVLGAVILCLGADLIDAPLRLDGDRRWEHVYREEDAMRWVAAHRPGQPVLADSVSGAFLEWYFMKTGYFPPRYEAIECDRKLSSLDVLKQALSAAREKGYPVVIHHKPDAPELSKEEQSMPGYEAVHVFAGRYRAIAIYAPRPKSGNESGNQN